jgi:hypothetical protein
MFGVSNILSDLSIFCFGIDVDMIGCGMRDQVVLVLCNCAGLCVMCIS